GAFTPATSADMEPPRGLIVNNAKRIQKAKAFIEAFFPRCFIPMEGTLLCQMRSRSFAVPLVLGCDERRRVNVPNLIFTLVPDLRTQSAIQANAERQNIVVYPMFGRSRFLGLAASEWDDARLKAQPWIWPPSNP